MADLIRSADPNAAPVPAGLKAVGRTKSVT